MQNIVERFDGDVSSEQIQTWIEQFDDSERRYIMPLLSHFRYYSSRRLFSLLKNLHQSVCSQYAVTTQNTVFIPVGYVAKSGSAVAYFYRRHNELPEAQFIALQDIYSSIPPNVTKVVFIDDFVGSGHASVTLWSEAVPLLKRMARIKTFILGCITAYEIGIAYAASKTGLGIVAADCIPDIERPFCDTSQVYDDPSERRAAKEIVKKYGQKLAPRQPLGHGGTQGLVSFFFSTPNNTLPIFWATKDNWMPLVPYGPGESLRDPRLLVGKPAGLPQEAVSRAPNRSIVEIQELEQFNISSETAIRILGEFQTLAVFLVLAPILQELAMPDKVLTDLLTLFRILSRAVHEKKAVRASILFPGKDGTDFVSQLKFCTCAEGLSLANTEEIVFLAGLGNGFDGTLIVKPDGYVCGTTFFSDGSPLQDTILPSRYWMIANASAKTAGLLILFAGEGDISLFHRGIRILSHRQSTWHIHPSTFDAALQEIQLNGGPPSTVLGDVLMLAFKLADQGLGALLTVGDHQSVLALGTQPKVDYVDWSSLNVADGDNRPLLALASQDGAIVVGEDGQIVKGMVYLHPPSDTVACEELISGSKHDTAAKISAATNAATVAVSVDRRVSVFFAGNRLFRVIG